MNGPVGKPPYLIVTHDGKSSIYVRVLFGPMPGEPIMSLLEVIPIHPEDAERDLDDLKSLLLTQTLRRRVVEVVR